MLSVKEDVIRVSYDWSRTNDKNQQIFFLFLPRKTRRTAPQTFGRTFHQRPWVAHFPEALADVDHSPENFPAHDHTQALIQKFSGSRASFPISSVVPSPVCQERGVHYYSNSQKNSPDGLLDVNIIICSHKPFAFVQVVVMHVLEHHERLLLGAAGVGPRPAAAPLELRSMCLNPHWRRIQLSQELSWTTSWN